MRKRVPLAATLTTAVLLAAPGSALAASAGETFLAGGLELPAGASAGGPSGSFEGSPTRVSVSADGRWIAFATDADALAPEADPDLTAIVRKDRVTGAVTLVSRASGAAGAPAAEGGELPVISDDGSRVAWRTSAALDPADTDGGRRDVYVRDLAAGTTTLASVGDGGAQTSAETGGFDLSGDGQFVAFSTAEGLAGATDANGRSDVYLRSLAAGTTQLVSRRAGGSAGNGDSWEPSVTRDGSAVAYTSRATDLAPGFVDGNANGTDVWLRAMGSGTQTLVSQRALTANTGGNGESTEPHVASPSAGVTYVAYVSAATDVAAGSTDTSATRSVYRRALSGSLSTLVSRAGGSAGANADRTAFARDISADGQRIVFDTTATNLGAPAALSSATYVRDLAINRTTHMSGVAYDTSMGGISADGTTVAWAAFEGTAPDADPDLPGVFAATLGGSVELVARPAAGSPVLAPAFEVEEREAAPELSADGRWVVFASRSRRLPGATGGLGSTVSQLYRRDLVTGAIELVSRADGTGGAPAAMDAIEPAISADGTRVAFATDASLDPADGDALSSVYVRDLATGTTTLASRADGPGGAANAAGAFSVRLSGDGRHVAFTSSSGFGVVAAGTPHVWVRDVATASTQLVDRSVGGVPGDDYAQDPSISGDGRLVAFVSSATNLVADDTDPERDVYVRDLVDGTTRLVSRRTGFDGAPSALDAYDPAISADGRVVAFVARDQQLAPEGGPWNGTRQVVVRDLAAGVTRLVSRAPGEGSVAAGIAEEPSIDADGSLVAFVSAATNLLPGRGGEERPAVFVRDIASGTLTGPPAFGRVANDVGNGAWQGGLSGDGRCLALIARGHNGATGAAGDLATLYVHGVGDGCGAADGGGGPGGGGPGGPGEPGAGGPGAAGEPGRPGGGGGDEVLAAPRLTGASLAARRFRVARGRTAVAAARGRTARRAPRRVPAGTTFGFSLSRPGDLTIAFERRAVGRRVAGQCRRPSRRLRRKARCTRWVAAGTLTRRALAAGRGRVAFSGRIGRRALVPGGYRAVLTARNAAGRSAPVRLAFTVVPR